MLYWQGTTQNAEGQLTQALLGNGLTTLMGYDVLSRKTAISTGVGAGSGVQYLNYRWDTLGNLQERRDANQNLTETFSYDALNRLTSANLASGRLDQA